MKSKINYEFYKIINQFQSSLINNNKTGLVVIIFSRDVHSPGSLEDRKGPINIDSRKRVNYANIVMNMKSCSCI